MPQCPIVGDANVCYAVGAGDVAFTSPEADDVTAGEPLSTNNITEKLHNEFVVPVVDLVNLLVEVLQLLSTVGVNVECRQLCFLLCIR